MDREVKKEVQMEKKMDHCSKGWREREGSGQGGRREQVGPGRSGSRAACPLLSPGWLVGRRCYSSSLAPRRVTKTRSLSGSSLEIMSWRRDFRGQPAPSMKPSFLWPEFRVWELRGPGGHLKETWSPQPISWGLPGSLCLILLGRQVN